MDDEGFETLPEYLERRKKEMAEEEEKLLPKAKKEYKQMINRIIEEIEKCRDNLDKKSLSRRQIFQFELITNIAISGWNQTKLSPQELPELEDATHIAETALLKMRTEMDHLDNPGWCR